VPIRTLADEGGPALPEDQVRAYAAAFPVLDEDSNRHLFDIEKQEFRPLTAADHFPANHSQKAPDLSLMAKSRAAFHGPYGLGINQLFQGTGGPEYIVALLNGYAEAPACATGDEEGYYNTAFANGGIPESCKNEEGHSTIPGSWIAMPPPLSDDQVTYADGHEADVHHMAMDTAAFLMWAAEPKMMARKEAGFIGVFFLSILAVLLYLTNKRLWASVKGRKTHPAE
jgi:ubiquinol-cytochrome c reductase cytochrome c1 subunit